MRVTVDLEHLRNLKEATNAAIKRAIRRRRKIEGAVNWADLHCICAEACFDEEGNMNYRVSIEEVAPDANEFAMFIHGDLAKNGFKAIEVRTEW